MKGSLDKNAKVIVLISGLAGLLIAGCGIVSAVDKFAWGAVIMNFLYLLCCFWLLYYQLSGTFSSKQLFLSLIITYSICVVLRDLVFPAEGLPGILEVLVSLLSVSEIGALLILNSSWKRAVRIKSALLYMFSADCVVSAVWTWNAVSCGSDFFTIAAYWSRTLIAFCLVYCYLARMNAKARENTETPV